MMMKKLFLFLTVVVLGISLSSCLTGGKQRFSEPAIVYIDQSDLPPYSTYGKTHSGNGITNPKIELMQPGTFKMFYYLWEEDFGTTAIGNGTLLNVEISGEIVDINKTTLEPGYGSIETERGTPFKAIGSPIYDQKGVWFKDYWVFQYSYNGKEGQTPNVKFSLREEEGENSSGTKLLKVDMRLNLVGEPKEGATSNNLTSWIAVDMRYIRDAFLRNKDDKVEVKFYYYNTEEGEITSSQNNWPMVYFSAEQ